MTSPAVKQDTVVWTPAMRTAWAKLTERRGKTGALFLWMGGPYALSGAMMGFGAMGNGDHDAMALVGTGALIFLIFLALAPFWITTLLKEWRSETRAIEADRKAFWTRHGVDPFAETPPPAVVGERAPWE